MRRPKIKVKFRGTTHRNGGFGHHIAKYKKHPVIVHNMKIQCLSKEKKAKLIKNKFSSVFELISCEGV
jgi:hypothetical protein